MPLLPKSILKTFFEAGDRPTQQQFSAFIDSSLNLVDDRIYLGLKEHQVNVQYVVGDTVLYDGLIYQAVLGGIGAFDPQKWKRLNLSALNFAGTWDAAANVPSLQSGTGTKGDYYVVSTAGTTNLDGETNWELRDWAVFNGTVWQRVDNSDLGSQIAALVPFDNQPSGMNATNVQDAIDELQLRIDTNDTDIGNLQLNKTDKLPSAVDGNFAGFLNGNLSDLGKNPGDYLHKGNTTAFTPSLDYDPATKKYVDDHVSAMTAADVTIVPGGILSTATNVQDAVDKLASINATDIAYSGTVPAADVKNAIDQLDQNKQNAFGYTPVPETRTINTHPLSSDVTLSKDDIGLNNVQNVDTTNAANITEDPTHRFVSDTDKITWNAKQDAITTGTTAQYLRGDLSLGTMNKAAVGLSNVPNTDTTNPANISTDATHRFVTDAQIGSWNAKQENLGFVPVPETRQINGLPLSSDILLTKNELGLSNVVNLDTSNPTNISQDGTHRFVTDAQITSWNSKQGAITTGTTAQYFRGDLSLATMDKNAVGLGNVTNDRQLSMKHYLQDESGTYTATNNPSFTETFAFIRTFTPVAGDYLIEWYAEISNSSAGAAGGIRVMLDSTVLSTSAHVIGLANQTFAMTGFIQVTGVTATDHIIRIFYNHPTGNGTTSFFRPRVNITKI